jgi:uncharacterized membrane protein YedE/YeeE
MVTNQAAISGGKRMNSTSFTDLLQRFETDRVIAFLQTLDLQELIQNPYFLGGTGALAIIALLMRWRLLLVTILSISGFVWLLSYTLAHDTSLEGGMTNSTLIVFVFGGAVIVFLAIYFLFIRGD